MKHPQHREHIDPGSIGRKPWRITVLDLLAAVFIGTVIGVLLAWRG